MEALLRPVLGVGDPEVNWHLADVLATQGKFNEAETQMEIAPPGSNPFSNDTCLPSRITVRSSTLKAATTSTGLLGWRESTLEIDRRCERLRKHTASPWPWAMLRLLLSFFLRSRRDGVTRQRAGYHHSRKINRAIMKGQPHDDRNAGLPRGE
jgi:hypothetical protein